MANKSKTRGTVFSHKVKVNGEGKGKINHDIAAPVNRAMKDINKTG